MTTTTNIRYFAFTVDDVALPDYCSPDHLRRLYDFLAEEKIPATFFAVPETAEGVTIGKRPGYPEALADGIARGHEFAQHGITHDRFEIGIPPAMILELPHEGPARAFLAKNRDRLAAEFTVETIRARLRRGRTILEEALGRPVQGFRAPSLQTCDNLWPALAAEGYTFDSSTCFQPTGWDILNGRLDVPPQPITRAGYEARQRVDGAKEFPLTTDYAWFLERAKYDVTMNLAKHDVLDCFRENVPFVPVCHVSPVQQGEGNVGFDLLRELLAWMRRTADEQGVTLRAVTLSELATLV